MSKDSSVLHINPTSVSYDKSGTTVKFSFSLRGDQYKFYYTVMSRQLTIDQTQLDDAAMVLALQLGMRTASRITMDSNGVSKELLENIGTIQDVWARWWPEKYSKVVIDTKARTDTPSVATGEGSMATFTGGVDSFYTLEKHKDNISSLVYVYGYDTSVSDKGFNSRVRRHLIDSVEFYGKDIIEIETNIRDELKEHIDWLDYHGAAIAAVGMILGRVSHHLYIPSTRTYTDPTPIGSHPLTDPLWSTEYLSIEHDGAGTTRVEKIAHISEIEAVQRNLRVCWKSNTKINCGVCEKCTRTMIALEAIGSLEAFETFPHEVSDEQLTTPLQPHYYPYIEDIVDWINKSGDHSNDERISKALFPLVDEFKLSQDKDKVIAAVKKLDDKTLVEALSRAGMRRLARITGKVVLQKALRRVRFR